MELVILSSIAAAAILIAELRDLAGREQIGRGLTAAAPHPAAVTNLVTANRAANEEIVAPQPGLDRAA